MPSTGTPGKNRNQLLVSPRHPKLPDRRLLHGRRRQDPGGPQLRLHLDFPRVERGVDAKAGPGQGLWGMASHRRHPPRTERRRLQGGSDVGSGHQAGGGQEALR